MFSKDLMANIDEIVSRYIEIEYDIWDFQWLIFLNFTIPRKWEKGWANGPMESNQTNPRKKDEPESPNWRARVKYMAQLKIAKEKKS